MAHWRLRLVDRGQRRDSLRYCFVLRLRHTQPSLLSVISADCVFALVGRNLDELKRPIDKDRVSEVQVFNALSHRPPSPTASLIEKIRSGPCREAGECLMH